MGFTDDFNDNSLNTDLWKIGLQGGTGAVVEANQRLEIRCPGSYDRAVLVTADKHDLADGYVKVKANADNLNIIGLYISPTQNLGAYPQFLSDSYGIEIGSKGTTVRVYKGGSLLNTFGAPSSELTLKMAIEGGRIKLYYDDNLALDEEYAYESTEVYVYLAGQGYDTETGTGWFDDFELYTKPPPPTLQETISSFVNSMIPIVGLMVTVPLLKSSIKKIKETRR